jgi:hypothetical protein
MKLVGANPQAKVSGLEELPGKSNYFIGNDPKKWRTNVPNYAKVKYANVYPGVDLVYYGNQRQLEYDFVVQPGADPRSVQLAITSDGQVGSRQKAVGSATEDPTAESQSAIDNRKSSIPAPLHVNAAGDLVVGTDGGEVIFHKPVVYQPATYNEPRTKNQEPTATNKELVDGRYMLNGNRVTFEVANYDKTRPLVIDPTLAYSTYLGGTRLDNGFAIAVDASGNAYVTGETSSSDFPTTPGAFQTTYGGAGNAFITKLNAAGSALVYSTYLGGSGGDGGGGIALDASGNAYVTGTTSSSNFPTTPGAFQTSCSSCPFPHAFVSKLSADGSALVYSTYLGGVIFDSGIALDTSDNAYVTGTTTSSNFPTTPGAYQTTLVGTSDAYVSKLNAAGSALLYSTYLGGSVPAFSGATTEGRGIAVDASGNAYITGDTECTDFPTTPGAFQATFSGAYSDAFITKLNAAGSNLVYSTYLGGGSDEGWAIALDSSENAYVTGRTESSSFPTTPGAFQTIFGGGNEADAFVTKLNPIGSRLLYSTYLGGQRGDDGFGVVVDPSGNAYVTGATFSSDFPTTPDAFQTFLRGGFENAFFTKLNAAGSALVYSTFLGGSEKKTINVHYGIALDASGNAYLTGSTFSYDFPTTPHAFHRFFHGGGADAFVSKFSFATGGPAVSLSPTSLTFAPQQVGTFSAPQQATLTNTGGAALTITSIRRSGDFYCADSCPRTLRAGAACTITVTFTPTSGGTRLGKVTITDNAPDSPQKLPLSGTGSGTGSIILSLSPPSLSFGSVTVGSSSSPQTVTVTNTGTVAASFLDPFGFTIRGADPKDFEEQPSCGTSLAPNKSCTVAVTFKPTASGARKGIFLVRQGAASVQIPLSGTGT